MPSEMPKILIADDEEKMRRLLSDYLKRDGYMPVPAADGIEALDKFTQDPSIALVILDVMMPGKDGWTVCREIRRTSKVPVIMLTARGEENDELFGFEIGADEYVKKPFSPSVLMARVKALIRRTKSGDGEVIKIGNFTLDKSRRAAFNFGEEIILSPKEYELLEFFVLNEGIALSRDKILYSVWDVAYFGDGRTVDTHVKRLREKMGSLAPLIQTVRGFGYRFEGEVKK